MKCILEIQFHKMHQLYGKKNRGAGLPRFVDRAKSIVGVGLGSDRKNVVRENENNSIDEGLSIFIT